MNIRGTQKRFQFASVNLYIVTPVCAYRRINITEAT
jgi:hypothetical protein